MDSSDPVAERFGVRLETGGCDSQGEQTYRLVVDGEVVLTTRVEALAVVEYEEAVGSRRAAATARLRAEKAEADFRAMRSSSWAEKSKRDSRPGGRGGVGRR